MKKSFLLPVLMTLLTACGSNKNKNTGENTPEGQSSGNSRLKGAEWFLGTWVIETPEGRFTETWKEENDTVFRGAGLMMSPKGDTLFKEHLKLAYRNGAFCYIPLIGNQNNGEEVEFKETQRSATEIIFENPTHDFPKRIVYRKPAPDSLYARVEGMQNGIFRQEVFHFIKK